MTYLHTLILCSDGNVAILSQQWSPLPLIDDEKYIIVLPTDAGGKCALTLKILAYWITHYTTSDSTMLYYRKAGIYYEKRIK